MTTIVENLKRIRDRIERAVIAAGGRVPGPVTLIAVSKAQPIDAIREAYDAGQRDFGENYIQELQKKAIALSDLPIIWHFIGHLQKNKARHLAPLVRMVQTIDSLDVAKALHERASRPIDILIQINIGEERTKAGVYADDTIALFKELAPFHRLRPRGLMCIPPYHADSEKSRPYFQKMRQLLAALNGEHLTASPLDELSMGMSSDFECAIQEGATMVRIGTAIFGGRTAKG